jgi:hypothetical protein
VTNLHVVVDELDIVVRHEQLHDVRLDSPLWRAGRMKGKRRGGSNQSPGRPGLAWAALTRAHLILRFLTGAGWLRRPCEVRVGGIVGENAGSTRL